MPFISKRALDDKVHAAFLSGYDSGRDDAVDGITADWNDGMKIGRNVGYDEGIQSVVGIITRIQLELSGATPDDGEGS